MSKFDDWGNEKDSESTYGWDIECGYIESDTNLPLESSSCGGVRYEPEGSKGSFDWGLAISPFLLIGMISIIGHLINMWRNQEQRYQ